MRTFLVKLIGTFMDMKLIKLSEWKRKEGYTLPLFLVARIVGVKNANYFNELWNNGKAERVKNWIREAEERFTNICKSK